MRPTLEPGDFVLVNERAFDDKTPAVQDLVLARHPFRDLLIVKRVSQVDDGRLSLRGDNDAESMDSRGFGSVAMSQVIGRVTCRLG